MNENKPITLGQATRFLGFDGDDQGRALLRELEARERALRVEIVQRGPGPKNVHKRVTIAAIRQHAPDLVPSRAERVLLEVTGYLREIDERVDDRVDERFETLYASRIAPVIGQVKATQDRMADRLLDVTKAVARLSPGSSPKPPNPAPGSVAPPPPDQRQ